MQARLRQESAGCDAPFRRLWQTLRSFRRPERGFEGWPGIRFYMVMVRQTLRSTVQRIRIRISTVIGLVAAIVTAWWMKVEEARVPDAPPTIAFGEPVNVGRWVFTPQKLAIEPGKEAGERKLILTGFA
jgi:hypothetical protein